MYTLVDRFYVTFLIKWSQLFVSVQGKIYYNEYSHDIFLILWIEAALEAVPLL
jgi:hypothetical protein